MDLHLVGPPATPEEQAAVDAFLDARIGPARNGWEGGIRDVATDSRVARGGHEARARRDLLLPALHAIQDRIGWISQGALNHACKRLMVPPADAYGVATFYALLATVPRPARAVHVCDDMACRLAGAEQVCDDLERALGPAGHPTPGAPATWLRSPCLGQCERAPAALVTVAGDPPIRFATGPLDAAGILGHLEQPKEADQTGLAAHLDTVPSPGRLAALRQFIPQAGEPGLRLLARVGRIDPTSLTDYLANGGYRALKEATLLGPDRVIQEVITAEVLGRGGAAFPAGQKWAAARASIATPKNIVCNADEAEPGTFKDRAILEEDPFSLVEAMTIAGFAVGAELGWVYLRGEYPLAEARLQNALNQARNRGLLGRDIMRTGFDFDIEIRRGGGAYVCGEGTAIYESIEGKRGEPRNKAARSTTAGLFQKPTVLNNVETLANILDIILEGGEVYAALGTERSKGHKLFSVSGHVERPGVYEAEFGITLHDLLELAGGIRGGRGLKAVNLGGAAGTFVGPDAMHMPLTFEDAKEMGATLGAGAVVVFDETTDITDILRRIAEFFRDESCGQCVPCRVGTVRQEELLARLAAGRLNGALEDELALLADLGQVMRDASICGLGQTANDAVRTGLRFAAVHA
ncbi:MAG TPA: NAD(P)H-dependent oxidoreductase subunit E [Candidatus Limnocylindrales bacterium]|nr:NAD(P)H-dependent oxidoreductase subunit E [Candidatus Limnocylindrales bacterium]